MRFGRLGLWILGAVCALIASTRMVSAQTAFGPGGGLNLTSGTLQSSTISVSTVGTVTSVSVTLNGVKSDATTTGGGMSTTYFILQDPAGKQFVLLGATGSAAENLTGLNITIVDSASNGAPLLPTAWTTSGSVTVKPASDWNGLGGATGQAFPDGEPNNSDSPATDGSATLNGSFNGATANGTWTLLAEDDCNGIFGGTCSNTDGGGFTNWSLTLGINSTSVGTTTSISSTLNPSFSSTPNNSVAFTATVTSSSSTPTGTVAFSANGTGISGCGAQALNGSGQASCTTALTTQGLNLIGAAYTPTGSFSPSSSSFNQLVEVHATNPSGSTYCNNATLAVPGGFGSPTEMAYPSVVGVPSSVTNTVANVTVQLNNLSSVLGITDTSFLLVAPNGQNLDLLDGGFTNSSGGTVTLTFSDSASGSVPPGTTAPTTGTYLATDNRNTATSFPNSIPTARSIDSNIPAIPSSINYAQPFGGSGALNLGGAFSGAPAAGDWSLYIINGETSGDNISIGGWCLNFTLNSGSATTTAINSSQNPATPGTLVNFTATVTSGGNPVTSGTVTFADTSTNTILASGVALNGSGQAATSTSSLTEGDHKIVATYNGVPSTFNESTSFVWQREDDASTTTNLNMNPATFCNPGSILLPAGSGGPENIGQANPNPSNIFVTGLPGTIHTVAVTLENFHVVSTDTINNIASLLVGPNGSSAPSTTQTLDFFSETGGNPSSAVTSGNYAFADSAGSVVPQSAFSPGTYKPTSYAAGTDTFFASPSGFYILPGSLQYAATKGTSTLTGVYGNTIGNGTWSLYFDQNTHADGNGATNGWCRDSVHLDHHEFVRGEVGTNDVHDLTRSISSAAHRTLVTTSLGVINLGSRSDSEGTRHSAISHAVSALKFTVWPVGRYRQ